MNSRYRILKIVAQRKCPTEGKNCDCNSSCDEPPAPQFIFYDPSRINVFELKIIEPGGLLCGQNDMTLNSINSNVSLETNANSITDIYKKILEAEATGIYPQSYNIFEIQTDILCPKSSKHLEIEANLFCEESSKLQTEVNPFYSESTKLLDTEINVSSPEPKQLLETETNVFSLDSSDLLDTGANIFDLDSNRVLEAETDIFCSESSNISAEINIPCPDSSNVPDESNIPCPDSSKIDIETRICPECNNSYLNYSCLRKHVKKCHPSILHSLTTPKQAIKNLPYECDLCKKKYSRSSVLSYHKHKIHGASKKVFNKNVLCPLCSKMIKKTIFILHCKSEHDIIINTEVLKFSTSQEFSHWKENMEVITNARFVKKHGWRKCNNGSLTVTFFCHRSGKFISKGKGQRCLKKQGSFKINSYCPASIVVNKTNDDKHEIHFTATHVGHDTDISHIHLSQKERNILASKLKTNENLDEVLDEIKESELTKTLKRLQILKRKDLYNIKQCLKTKIGNNNNEKNDLTESQH